MKVEINSLKCVKCGHIWNPRKDIIIICPKCKTKYWNKKR